MPAPHTSLPKAGMTYEQAMARSSAFMNALASQRGMLEPGASYTRLRESYATGKITLGQFEAEVSVLLRSAR